MAQSVQPINNCIEAGSLDLVSGGTSHVRVGTYEVFADV
jgi:hypothetical protein